jgi:hypothetical protein
VFEAWLSRRAVRRAERRRDAVLWLVREQGPIDTARINKILRGDKTGVLARLEADGVVWSGIGVLPDGTRRRYWSLTAGKAEDAS